ncbi:hypothetical protein F5Y12DRAFT_711517 [Xylaria sp. FL1777]|nr:hypothetical protein F5Y12DRAFT_711517 [Xylaria sp. FL1777]
MSPSHHYLTKPHLPSFFILLLQLLALATATNAAAAEEPPSFLHQRQTMSAGSSCDGAEGQWNCMTGSFQRCGSGQWSEVQQCALGTRCSPSGLTYEFHVDFVDGYLGAAPPVTTSGGGVSRFRGRGALDKWWLLGGLVVLFILLS